MKTLSMIIPHYNDSERCKTLLSSLKEGLFKEIILVDDASEEKHVHSLKEMINEFKHLPLTLIELTSQSGAGKARNEGLKHITSDYVIFVDSDDVLTSNHEVILKEAVNQNMDVVYFAPTSHTLNKTLGRRHTRYDSLVNHYLNDMTAISEAKLCTHFFIPVSKVISTSLIKAHNITFDEVMVSNDVMFSLKVGLLAAKIAANSRPFYSILEHSSGLTQRKDTESLLTRAQVFINFVKMTQTHYEEQVFKALNIRGDSLVIQAYKAQGKIFAKEVKQLFKKHGVHVSRLRVLLKTKQWI
jgi:glycosyltransferase involved in cell wall biosynthesis